MESEKSRKRDIITGVVISAVIFAILSLVIFTTVIPNATKGNMNKNESVVINSDVVGVYRAYAAIDDEGNENKEEIEKLKEELGYEMYVYFEKDGTGALVRESDAADEQLALPFTFDNDGNMTVKKTVDGNTTTYEGHYTLSEDKSSVAVVDNSGSTVLFSRVEEEQ